MEHVYILIFRFQQYNDDYQPTIGEKIIGYYSTEEIAQQALDVFLQDEIRTSRATLKDVPAMAMYVKQLEENKVRYFHTKDWISRPQEYWLPAFYVKKEMLDEKV